MEFQVTVIKYRGEYFASTHPPGEQPAMFGDAEVVFTIEEDLDENTELASLYQKALDEASRRGILNVSGLL